MKKADSPFEVETFEYRTDLAIDWLRKAFFATGEKGFAAYFEKRPFTKGKWSSSYPETTGYLITTLLAYAPIKKEEQLVSMALAAANWICTLQDSNGALPGGLGEQGPPSIFNTGQMIFGLVSAYEHTPKEQYIQTLLRATNWLLNCLEEDGSWQQGAFISGHTPSYYTRVIWAVLKANTLLKIPLLEERMMTALRYYAQKQTQQYSITDWNMYPDQLATTHEIAYTLRGFWEAGRLLQQDFFQTLVLNAADQLTYQLFKKGKLAGAYSLTWDGNYNYQCLPGNAQLSLLFHKLFTKTQEEKYRAAIPLCFQPLLSAQSIQEGAKNKGAISGSLPYWERYQRFRYLNWSIKFFLDAYLSLYTDSAQYNHLFR